jgi:tRNA G46 methylase TrmB
MMINETIAKRLTSDSNSAITVELGMGDGMLLKKLLEQDKKNNSIYIGIELDNSNYEKARSAINHHNTILLNGSFEELINDFPDYSINNIIAVLPDPDFIERQKQQRWQKFYAIMYRKLCRHGMFRLVTELIDDLLQPVADEEYNKWVEWLIATFHSIGFAIVDRQEGAPSEYSSRCLERFKGDPERIRLVTLNFIKQE